MMSSICLTFGFIRPMSTFGGFILQLAYYLYCHYTTKSQIHQNVTISKCISVGVDIKGFAMLIVLTTRPTVRKAFSSYGWCCSSSSIQ